MSSSTEALLVDDEPLPLSVYDDEPVAHRAHRDPIVIDAEPVDETEPKSYGGHTYGGGRFELLNSRKSGGGVYFTEKDKEGNETEHWVCSPLYVTAKTRDQNSHDWGRLLEWTDDDHNPHRWAVPAAMLQGDGLDVRRELATGGLHISPSGKARNLLTAYIQTLPVDVRARCVKRLGWHAGAYVTPDHVYGEAEGERPVFQSESGVLPENSASGTVDEWRDRVAALAVGNSRLVFALCVSFAGPLLEIAGEDSGGFHLRGSSSTGKTTALRLAASVWGQPARYVRTWRATTNGLEGVAAIHNDGLLILDEIHQCDPREAAEAAYMLANGQGKSRASRTGTAREAASWRLLFLSSGEQSLADRLGSIGKKATAGQQVRLADIPADAGRGMGIIEELHGAETSGELVARLAEGYEHAHGTVASTWLDRLATDRLAIAADLRQNLDAVTDELTVGTSASGQSGRVARRFALAALAGDLATRYGLTGWAPDEALNAACICFRAWLEAFGGAGNREVRDLLAQVRGFLEAHASSRFEPASGGDPERGPLIRDRVGFVRSDGAGGHQYLVLPEAFRTELVTGFDSKWAARVLAERDWLLTQDERHTCVERIPAYSSRPVRVYVLTQLAAGGGE